mmetsp:Transcript_33647/g.52599  ORF Transcript_33647/g.52599 Transcript_33647/m.52599 type:complete len:588 (-) Transcript_33647:57-1820(-)|eukprot:CAMPEP_0201521184 /NCGR_PEP_ID=MMETSP0161_2-20130828/14268_1 /ASSEMBLY_ACC=CAM_ASM_000251 /TAXON_ID=180227 /ORGANISM="Neoparamoeba aestuarina, Strain SoJaBio B1-5/56/2" /LENGTH=587 /DNA_ID=CAMNT_0047919773 /DNA_START=78 /DNA_END=1841 /DNA_ORIENTATION=-
MKGLLAILLAVCLISSVFAGCEFDCVHGSCYDNECECDSNYIGDDCSVYSKDINDGKNYSGSVQEEAWRYYVLDSSDQETITWTVFVDDSTQDADLYIQKDSYPSLYNFLSCNTTVSPVVSVKLENVEPGKYIAGVFGFSKVDNYNIIAEYSSACALDCNNHGTCKKGVCECDDNYMGEACEVQVVKPGKSYSGYSHDLFQWNYFAWKADKFYESITWEVTAIDETDHNCEMFTATDREPSFFYFDATTIGFSEDPVSLEVTEVEEGRTYYMSVNGLFGFVGCNFTMTLHTTEPSSPTECPNQCSNHGLSSTCNNNQCNCNSSYTGQECEEYTPNMVLQTKYKGYVGNDAWNYYHFDDESTQNTLIADLKRTSDGGDVDLYIGDGFKPTLYNYTFCNLSIGTEMTLELDQPVGHTWYFGVFGWDGAEYALKITDTTKCICVDSHHGSCDDNDPEVCNCKSGYAGEDCGSPLIPLSSGQPLMNQQVDIDEWNYYSIAVDDASAAQLTVQEHGEVGVAWVFVGFDAFPTATNYGYSDKNHHNATHQLSYLSKNNQTGTLYVGVYGSPFVPEVGGASNVTYDIVAWVSDF